jgi:hypothetical protein
MKGRPAFAAQGRRYGYVGPGELLDDAEPRRAGTEITSTSDLDAWLSSRPTMELDEPFTFVVDLTGTLRLAPRRSEHVACAAGQPILAAGEIGFTRHGIGWTVTQISNQSTGYCPETTSWTQTAAALDQARIPHPGHFTDAFIFRRCPDCAQINIIKDDDYTCGVCDHPLHVQR